EDVFDVIELVRVLVGAGVTELIVTGTLLAVGEDLVSLGCFLELLDGVGVAGVAVGVKIDRQLAISPGNLTVGSVALPPKDFVVVAFGSHRRHGRRQPSLKPGCLAGSGDLGKFTSPLTGSCQIVFPV